MKYTFVFDAEYVQELIRYCESNLIRVKFVPDFSNFTKSRKVQIDFYENIPVISLRREPLESIFNPILKRAFDIVFSLLVIVLIFPWLFPVLIMLVKTSSKGAVFFKQKRSGENNQTFWCYKFRTMRVNSGADEQQATRDDKRVTYVGKFLRKTNLDELPQFFNVLRGDMSVVGPRPHMLKHTKEYSELINAYLVRHLIRPGITGWAQVNGYRGETSDIKQMKKRVEYDTWYIENWSFLLDLRIIYKTVANIFNGNENAM
jgi:putative colanic acid biosysnthesis UDP-glucose lipid carrier transferase